MAARKLRDCVEGEVVKIYGAKHEGYEIYKVVRVDDTNFTGLLETEKTHRKVQTAVWYPESATWGDAVVRHDGLVDDKKAWPTVYPVKALPVRPREASDG